MHSDSGNGWLSSLFIDCCLIQLSMSARENRNVPPTLTVRFLLASASRQIVLSVAFRESAPLVAMIPLSPSLDAMDIAI
jgi:hypothetical protein